MQKIPSIPDDLQEKLQERMKGQFEPLFKSNGEPAMNKNLAQESVQVGFCKKTGKIYGGEQGFYTLAYHDYLDEKEQKYIRSWRSSGLEKSRFEKAKKIKFSEWKGEQFSDGDDFYLDLDEFFDGMIEEHGFQYGLWQKYIWPTKPEPIIKAKDAFRVYENDMEEVSDEYDWNIQGVKELQDALDDFVISNIETVAYYPDYSTVLLIDEQIEEFKKNYED